ncbi:MAG: hypothetical protein AAFR51_10865 [Pseudomonadota bacterium]
MISQQDLSGWFDQIRSRTGWSAKIPKLKWILLQALVPMPIIALVLFGLEVWLDMGLIRIAIFSTVFPAISGAFSGWRWDADQKLLSK